MKTLLILVNYMAVCLVCSAYGLRITYPDSHGKNISHSIESEEIESGGKNSESLSSSSDSHRSKRGVGHLIAKSVGHLAAKSILGGGLLKAGGKLVKTKRNLGGKLIDTVRNFGKEEKAICETRLVEKEKPHCETVPVEECVTEFEKECKQENIRECTTKNVKKCKEEYRRECNTENARKCKMVDVTKCETDTTEKCEDNITTECHEEEKEECSVEYEEKCWDEKAVVERRCSLTDERVCTGKVKRSDDLSTDELENMSARELLEVVSAASIDEGTEGPRNRRGAHAVAKHAGKKAVLASKVFYKLRNLFQEKVPDKCEAVPREHCIEVPVEKCSDNKQCHYITTTKCEKVPKEEKCWVKPHETCHDVTNTKCWLEPHEKCWEEPEEKCWDEEVEKCWDEPHEKCWDEEVEKCWDEPHEKCWKVPTEKCTSKPHTTCVTKTVEVPEKWCRMKNGKW